MKKKTGISLIIGSFILLILIYISIRIALNIIAASWLIPDTVTDINQYTTIRNQWASSGLVKHFPLSLPTHRTDLRLSSHPGFLQGGSHIQLLIMLPSDEVAILKSTLQQSAIHVYVGGGMFTHYNLDQSNNVPTTSFHTGGQNSFPDDYTLYVLHAKKYAGSWSAGETYGIVISAETNEVIYWAESW